MVAFFQTQGVRIYVCLYDCFVNSVRNREPTARLFTLDGVSTLKQKQLRKSKKNPTSVSQSSANRARKDKRGTSTPAGHGSSQHSGSDRATRNIAKSSVSKGPGRKQADRTHKSNSVNDHNSAVIAPVTSTSVDSVRQSAKSTDGFSAVSADARTSKTTSVTRSSGKDASVTTANSSQSHSHDLRNRNSTISPEKSSSHRAATHGARSKDGSSAVSADSRAPPETTSVGGRSGRKDASKSSGNVLKSNSNDSDAEIPTVNSSSSGIRQQSIGPSLSSEVVVLVERVSDVSHTVAGSGVSVNATTSVKTLAATSQLSAASTRTQPVTIRSSPKIASSIRTASSSRAVADKNTASNTHSLRSHDATVDASRIAAAPNADIAATAAVRVDVVSSEASTMASRSNAAGARVQSTSASRQTHAAAVTHPSAGR